MRIAVFGAGGFVGGWICEELAQQSDIEQVAFVRQWASAVRVARRGIPLRQIDLEDVDALPAVLAGVDAVVNAAMLPPSREPELVTTLYSACANAGVRRFVQLSSAAVYGDLTGHVDELSTPAPATDYARAKVAMEESLRRTAGRSHPQLFILRPSIIYGPFSTAWTTRYAARIVDGRWRGLGRLGEGTCNLIHARDVARAAIAATTADVAPGVHVLNINGPEAVTWNSYIERLGDALGVTDRVTPNAALFRGRAVAAEIMRRAATIAWVRQAYRRSAGAARAAIQNVQATTNLYPSLVELKLLGRIVHYTADQASRILAFHPSMPLETGLQQSATWCRVHGVA
jgi:nucleoside-diphosphate-sugar epimerase